MAVLRRTNAGGTSRKLFVVLCRKSEIREGVSGRFRAFQERANSGQTSDGRSVWRFTDLRHFVTLVAGIIPKWQDKSRNKVVVAGPYGALHGPTRTPGVDRKAESLLICRADVQRPVSPAGESGRSPL